jgi:hypothetical protein
MEEPVAQVGILKSGEVEGAKVVGHVGIEAADDAVIHIGVVPEFLAEAVVLPAACQQTGEIAEIDLVAGTNVRPLHQVPGHAVNGGELRIAQNGLGFRL